MQTDTHSLITHKYNFLKSEWRAAYRAARLVRRLERDLLGGRLCSIATSDQGEFADLAHRASFGHTSRSPVAGPVGRLP